MLRRLTAEAIADAHAKDLEAQERHGVNYIRYWFNAERGEVFCLVEAPSAEAADAVQKEAHGPRSGRDNRGQRRVVAP